MALRKLLGVDTLIAKDNKEIDVASLEGKVTFLYFSAHWCPPCKQFTPVLTKLYNSLKAQKKEFEIIFISSDKSQEQFDEYFKGMPWVALPWALRKQKDKLSRKLKVQSIPTLATIDETGRIVTTKARASVMQDQEGKEFPWLPKNPWEILKGAKLVTAEGAAAVSVDDLKRKDSIALYFSAHWCPPCRAFTPRLTSIYRKLQAKGTAMDIVFVSLDQAEEEYAEYLAEMPWLALTLGDNRIRELSELLGVEGIPALITIKPDGSIINAEAKEVADDDEEGTQYPWAAVSLPAVTSLNPSGNVVNALNGGICVLLSINGAPNATTALVEFNAAVQTFDAEVNKTRDAEEKVRFFTVDDSDETQVGLYKKVLGALGLGLPKHGEPTVVMMNLPNNRAYRFVSGELSQSNIVSSVTTFAKAQDE